MSKYFIFFFFVVAAFFLGRVSYSHETVEEKVILDLFMSNMVYISYEMKDRRVKDHIYESSRSACRNALRNEIPKGNKSLLLKWLSDVHVDLIFDDHFESQMIKNKIERFNVKSTNNQGFE